MPEEGFEKRDFFISVLGRTLEHLGVQMYKRRDTAIAELVANAWDARARNVWIKVPLESVYDPEVSEIRISDDGGGMSADDVQGKYMLVGRNRRRYDDGSDGRLVMGRKGIGKLAGFGIATRMTVETWCGGQKTTFTMNVDELKRQDGVTDRACIRGAVGPVSGTEGSDSGTSVILQSLKHVTPLSLERLCEALARRFSRTVRGEMRIFVNGAEIPDPELDLIRRVPEEGFDTAKLPDGSELRYYYAFSKNVIKSSEMRGFTVYVRGKTAQAPPFFFEVEGTASGQHATRYLTGAIEADFLDAGVDDETDVVSTDRQELDWQNEKTAALLKWGAELTRRALREWANRKGEETESRVMSDEKLRARIGRLDERSRKQVSSFLRSLGEADGDQERALELADALVRAYEYRHFHDVVKNIEAVADEPERLGELLTHLAEWRVLESRALLEVIKGRLDVVKKFAAMVGDDSPETAHKKGDDNLHDLIGLYPWLLDPEWQVLAEEKTVTKQLREWGDEEVKEPEGRERFDFLALADERRLVVIEIKRSGHAVELEDLQRLERYKEKLSKSGTRELRMVLIYGGVLNLTASTKKAWEERADGDLCEWREICDRTRQYYEHYRALLEGDVENTDFLRKQNEVARTRDVLNPGGAYRTPEQRRAGIPLDGKIGSE